jgi:hypothetical protein
LAKEHLAAVKPPDKRPSTSAAQVKRALKPLLDRHQDLALVGRWLIVKPVHHVVRGVLIDQTSSADVFSPRWAVMHLCEVRRSIFLNWGNPDMEPQLFRRSKRGQWLWSDPDVIRDLHETIEQDALPKLRSITTLADLMDQLSIPDRRFGTVRGPLTGW